MDKRVAELRYGLPADNQLLYEAAPELSQRRSCSASLLAVIRLSLIEVVPRSEQ